MKIILAGVLLLSSPALATTIIQDGNGQRIEDDNGDIIIQTGEGQSIVQSSKQDLSGTVISKSRNVSITSSDGESVMVINGKKIIVNSKGDVTVDGKACK